MTLTELNLNRLSLIDHKSSRLSPAIVGYSGSAGSQGTDVPLKMFGQQRLRGSTGVRQ
jgi:hypothetical protein